jgi:hypothetical protein
MESEINATTEQAQEEPPTAAENENYGNVLTGEATQGQDNRSNEVPAPKKSPRAQT